MQEGKDKKQKKLKLKDLPPPMREKYKNHPLFQKPKTTNTLRKTQDDKTQQQIKQLKEKKEKSIEERLAQYQIQSTEQAALTNVFNVLVYGKPTKQVTELDRERFKTKQKDGTYKYKESFGVEQVGHMLTKMFDTKNSQSMYKNEITSLSRSEIELMVWEIDENLDGVIDQHEFENMYKRCTQDEDDLEPKSLFHMVQFLMYIYSENRIDNEQRDTNDFKITQEDTLELLYVKKGRGKLDEEITYLFGENAETQKGDVEISLTFPQYLNRINERAVMERKNRIKEKKKLQNTLKKDEDEM